MKSAFNFQLDSNNTQLLQLCTWNSVWIWQLYHQVLF